MYICNNCSATPQDTTRLQRPPPRVMDCCIDAARGSIHHDSWVKLDMEVNSL